MFSYQRHSNYFHLIDYFLSIFCLKSILSTSLGSHQVGGDNNSYVKDRKKKCRNHATHSEWPLIWGSMQFCIYYKKICKLIYCKDFTQTGFSYSGIPLLIENVKVVKIFSTYYIFIKCVYQNILVFGLDI